MHCQSRLWQFAIMQELEYVEFFAGSANAYGAINTAGYPSCATDITYLEDVAVGTNPFDILTDSGLGLRT